jgi:hypothetical protein
MYLHSTDMECISTPLHPVATRELKPCSCPWLPLSPSIMSAHSWESRYNNPHAWEARAFIDDEIGDFWGECSDDEHEPEVVDSPGSLLVSTILDHYLFGRMSAKQCCEMMFYAERCGIQEAVPYSLRPSSPSGHFARKLKAALGHVGSTD